MLAEQTKPGCTEEDLVRWLYNCRDINYTYEVTENLLDVMGQQDQKLQDLYARRMSRTSKHLLQIMNRGVRVDKAQKEELYQFFSSMMEDIKKSINDILGFEFNLNSTPQKKKLFKDFFGMKLKIKRGKGTETCDSAAMWEYVEEYPEYKPLFMLMLEYNAIKVITTNFLGMKLDDDGRARTSYKMAGTATGRLASSKNPRGKGGNLQNIPEKGKLDLKYSLHVVEETVAGRDDTPSENDSDLLYHDLVVEGSILLPNVKKIYLPDEGMELADADYSGADAMIVAWESECKWLIDFFLNRSEKLYAYIASEHLQREITSASPEYKPYKAVCHGSNYGLGVDKLASMLGISRDYAQQLQDFYFNLCPEIRLWQERIRNEINTRGYISNIFGRRGWFLNKNDATLYNKAYAFIPQSSIADLVTEAMDNIMDNYSHIQVLLQVHDSLVFQYPIVRAAECRKQILDGMVIELPYPTPLRIPADMKVSTKSYGDTVKVREVAKTDNHKKLAPMFN